IELEAHAGARAPQRACRASHPAVAKRRKRRFSRTRALAPSLLLPSEQTLNYGGQEAARMLVRDVMQTKLFTVTPQTTLPEAARTTSQGGIRHLPVLDGDQLVGILSDRDLKRAMASSSTSLEAHELADLINRVRVDEIMTRTVITIAPISPIETAACLMVQEKIGALLVTDGSRLVGIVTETDVLRLLVRAMGATELLSSRLDVVVGNRPHAVSEVVQAAEAAGAEISSLMTLTGE